MRLARFSETRLLLIEASADLSPLATRRSMIAPRERPSVLRDSNSMMRLAVSPRGLMRPERAGAHLLDDFEGLKLAFFFLKLRAELCDLFGYLFIGRVDAFHPSNTAKKNQNLRSNIALFRVESRAYTYHNPAG